MTHEERTEANSREIDRLIMLATKHNEAIASLATSIEGVAANVEAHDRQIEALIIAAERQRAALEQMGREWQAYVKTLPRQ